MRRLLRKTRLGTKSDRDPQGVSSNPPPGREREQNPSAKGSSAEKRQRYDERRGQVERAAGGAEKRWRDATEEAVVQRGTERERENALNGCCCVPLLV